MDFFTSRPFKKEHPLVDYYSETMISESLSVSASNNTFTLSRLLVFKWIALDVIDDLCTREKLPLAESRAQFHERVHLCNV